jgi:hypothetical protein
MEFGIAPRNRPPWVRRAGGTDDLPILAAGRLVC